MGLITSMLRQTAVWWPLASSESAGIEVDQYGHPVYASPIEVDCRWEDRIEQFTDGRDILRMSQAIVYVDRDMEIGGVLMLGTEDDITDESDPLRNEGAYEIQRFDKMPDFKCRRFLRNCYL